MWLAFMCHAKGYFLFTHTHAYPFKWLSLNGIGLYSWHFITRKLPFSVSLSLRCRHYYNNLECMMERSQSEFLCSDLFNRRLLYCTVLWFTIAINGRVLFWWLEYNIASAHTFHSDMKSFPVHDVLLLDFSICSLLESYFSMNNGKLS